MKQKTKAIAFLPRYQALLFGVACIKTTNKQSLTLVYTDGVEETANIDPDMIAQFCAACHEENTNLMPDTTELISAIQDKRNTKH